MESQVLQHRKVGRPLRLVVNPGEKFGMLVTIEEVFGNKERTALYNCECGKIINLPIKAVLSGNTKSCGCLRKKIGAHNRASLIGQRFGRLIVIRRFGTSGPDRSKRTDWECKCACGNIIISNTNLLKTKHVQSCGCLRRENVVERRVTHGFKSAESTKEQKIFYKKWENIKNRCFNSRSRDYKYYGGRGIQVIWKNFEEFKKDMWDSFLEYLNTHTFKEATIDREDNDGNYCKENCRWVNQSVQVSNRRNLNLTKNK